MQSFAHHYFLRSIALCVPLIALGACEPMQEHKARREFEKEKESMVLPGNASTNRSHKPFGCDSRDLVNFSCD